MSLSKRTNPSFALRVIFLEDLPQAPAQASIIICRSLPSVPVMLAIVERYHDADDYSLCCLKAPTNIFRQVRCNSRKPCGNCSQAGLSCTYDAIPQKKGPKGSRAKVISELKETQKHSDLLLKGQGQSPPLSPTYARASGLLNQELIESCTDFFFTQMYPTMPILYKDQLHQSVSEMGSSVEAYCLITSLCAFMLIQPGIVLKAGHVMGESANSVTSPKMGSLLMEEAVRIRKGNDYIENPNVNTVITSFFLFGCCFGLNKHNSAWFHLREATALAQILGMQDEHSYMFDNVVETSRQRRLFWLLFVTER